MCNIVLNCTVYVSHVCSYTIYIVTILFDLVSFDSKHYITCMIHIHLYITTLPLHVQEHEYELFSQTSVLEAEILYLFYKHLNHP